MYGWCNNFCAGFSRKNHHWVTTSRRSWQDEVLSSELLKIDDRGSSSRFLLMQVNQSSGTVKTNQLRCIVDCWENFGLYDYKTEGKSADTSAQMPKKDYSEAGLGEAVSVKAEDYRGIVGWSSHLASQTMPDILATVTQLSRFPENPGRKHCVTAKRLFRYPKRNCVTTRRTIV